MSLVKSLPVLLPLMLAMNVCAAGDVLTLRNNPFTRPKALEVKPPAPQPKYAEQARPVELDLTATMVSDSAPMVIVNGELLGLGDRIRGLKLVEVMEGRAVFLQSGKRLTFSIEGEDE